MFVADYGDLRNWSLVRLLRATSVGLLGLLTLHLLIESVQEVDSLGYLS